MGIYMVGLQCSAATNEFSPGGPLAKFSSRIVKKHGGASWQECMRVSLGMALCVHARVGMRSRASPSCKGLHTEFAVAALVAA